MNADGTHDEIEKRHEASGADNRPFLFVCLFVFVSFATSPTARFARPGTGAVLPPLRARGGFVFARKIDGSSENKNKRRERPSHVENEVREARRTRRASAERRARG